MHKEFLSLGQQPPLSILYSDRALLAVDKPSGLLFHGYTKGLPTALVDQVKAHIQQEKQSEGSVYVGVVHRLDRPVSGVALFARNSKVAGRLGELFQSRGLDKIYLALVEGIPNEEQAVLEDMLEAPPSTDRPNLKGPQFCSLSYELVSHKGGKSLLAVRLGTGRRHQIRRQLSLRGWPIVGDVEYGAKTLLEGTENLDIRFRPIALQASRLHLKHPITGEELHIEAPLPWYWPALDINKNVPHLVP